MANAVQFTKGLQLTMGIEYVVAPYQADPQLVQLMNEKKIDYVWSSDTDMLAHGESRVMVDWDLQAPHFRHPERGSAKVMTVVW
jgi:5'-3' exonuclease